MEIIETKVTDQFPTDDWLLRVFDGWFDPCPLNDKPIVDGLKIEWKGKTYVNPPYSNVLPWVEKAIEEHKKGKTIVMLLKFDSTTKWFKKLISNGAHIVHIGERMRHGGKYAAPFSSMLAILG